MRELEESREARRQQELVEIMARESSDDVSMPPRAAVAGVGGGRRMSFDSAAVGAGGGRPRSHRENHSKSHVRGMSVDGSQSQRQRAGTSATDHSRRMSVEDLHGPRKAPSFTTAAAGTSPQRKMSLDDFRRVTAGSRARAETVAMEANANAQRNFEGRRRAESVGPRSDGLARSGSVGPVGGGHKRSGSLKRAVHPDFDFEGEGRVPLVRRSVGGSVKVGELVPGRAL